MVQVRVHFFDTHTEETRNRVCDGCFAIANDRITNGQDRRFITVLPQQFWTKLGARSDYAVVIDFDLDSDEWRLNHGIAAEFRDELARSVTNGQNFAVRVHGKAESFAKGVGSYSASLP